MSPLTILQIVGAWQFSGIPYWRWFLAYCAHFHHLPGVDLILGA